MTPDDLALLLQWLHADDAGAGWLPASARALRLNERNVRGMLKGSVAIPPTVALVVLVLVAAHSLLAGRRGQLVELQNMALSADTRARLNYWLKAIQ